MLKLFISQIRKVRILKLLLEDAARSALATVERRKSGKAARLREDVEEDADRPLKRAKTTSVTVCLRGLPVHVSVDAWSASL